MSSADRAARHALHTLRVADVAEASEDAVTVEFEVPRELRSLFEFAPGQHVALSSPDVDDTRRSYSICSPAGGPLRVGIKLLPGGRFSTHVRSEVQPGSRLAVLPPAGRFVADIQPDRRRHVVAIAAGSGITPIYSILASILAGEPHSTCTLIYGNRTTASTMLLDDVADLKDRHPERFQIFHVLSREPREVGFLEGRVDAAKLEKFAELIDFDAVGDWYLCGPLPMLEDLATALSRLGVPADRVHRELFHALDTEPVRASVATHPGAQVDIVLDGRRSTLALNPSDTCILDAALRVRSDAPYACKGGVCGTCRCRLVEGEVEMANRYALEDDELAAGIRLACQSLPISDHVVVDFDAV